ncbi:MAG: hypothetical protein RJB39_450 [Candidatus Parcubacteria bacterium]|jgi:cytochrome c biogenesis protein CcdA/thiol-disulfide isomerase/thioredoxin
MVLLFISFIAGVLTILAPCTLPVLPVIVGSSVGGEGDKLANRKKASIIASSLGASIILFTLLLKATSALISIPASVWAIVSGVIIIIFGLISLFPGFWEKLPFVAKLNSKSNILLGTGYQKKSIWGDVIIGASLGPVFSTCSPTYFVILATVLPQSFFLGLIYLLAYAIGLSGMLLLIAFLGQRLVGRLTSLSNPEGWFKRGLGILFIIIGVGIMFGIDKKIQTSILDAGLFDITKVEQRLLSLNDMSSGNTLGKAAPELVSPNGYINTDGEAITIAQYHGKKVVLLDVWTHSCINCQRTLPYVNAWYNKYKDQGLEIIGLHTPEFAFEKIQGNVEAAVKKYNITYPVVMDNNYKTWNAYGNQYWPRKYLIDENGNIIYDHIGEGGYEEMEKQIQMALMKLNAAHPEVKVSTDIVRPGDVINYEADKVQSPEIYFGSARNENLGNGKAGVLGKQELALPVRRSKNKVYLDGPWTFSPEYTKSGFAGTISFKYDARNVYMVASADEPMTVEIWVDGKKVKDLRIGEETLYTLVEGFDYGEHELQIRVPEEGLNAFTFTFG